MPTMGYCCTGIMEEGGRTGLNGRTARNVAVRLASVRPSRPRVVTEVVANQTGQSSPQGSGRCNTQCPKEVYCHCNGREAECPVEGR